MARPQNRIKSEKDFRFNFAERVRQSARNPDINRYNPHEKQRRFHISEHPGRQFLGGNRSGKTYGGACEAVYYATGKHPFKELPWKTPTRGRIVTTDLVQGLEKIILPVIKALMPASELINGSWEDSYSKELRTLTLANGSFIEFMTYEQALEKFAGTSRHWVWFDEEPPHDIFVECKLRLLDVNGHWWMTMTPVEGMTWTYDEIYESGDTLIDIIEVDMDDNPHLSEEGKATVLSGLSEDDIKARKKGQYIAQGGLIYADFIHEKFPKGNLVEDFQPPVGSLIVAAMDHGFTKATAWLWSCILENGRIVIFDEYYKRREIVQTHARNVHEINVSHGRPPAYNVGDPSIKNTDPITGTSVQIEYIENGIPIMLGNNDVRAGLDRVKKLIINKQLLVDTRCVNLLWEKKRYRWAEWKTSADRFDKNRKEEPQKKDDHACDAERYLVASRPVVEDLRPKPVGVNRSDNASEAIDPQKGMFDRGTLVPAAKQVDPHLGEEY
jgi:phage terminase large subunit-like protein